jgi:hypothetical protein
VPANVAPGMRATFSHLDDEMNDQIRTLRLLEIVPVKEAMQQAVKHAVAHKPPLRVYSQYGYGMDTSLELAVAALSLKDTRPSLVEACEDFKNTCEDVAVCFFNARAAADAEAARRDPLYRDYTKEDAERHFVAGGGPALVGKVQATYRKLTEELEALLA